MYSEAISAWKKRHSVFKVELNDDLVTEHEKSVRKGRVTMIEHVMASALLLQESDHDKAVAELNASIKSFNDAKVEVRDISGPLWLASQKVIRGQKL